MLSPLTLRVVEYLRLVKKANALAADASQVERGDVPYDEDLESIHSQMAGLRRRVSNVPEHSGH